ncbi:hypothetical protein D9611_005921 [Ephemerocybe angulata]|uniref:Uncharacterized protein n=1 Tax=Ephemerocybe angulata TaxID=980116 RepID=A0A8H5CG44_9AGAR|nr:hypothetical protein D9611_005921 [Tulosesus angulatus]
MGIRHSLPRLRHTTFTTSISNTIIYRMAMSSQSKGEAPLLQFFNLYSPGFQYDPQQPATSEFRRLRQYKGWKKKDPREKEAHFKFKQALTAQFNKNYGTDEESLTSWQALCAAVRIDPIPDTLQEARRAFGKVHVNLVDLTQGYDNGKPVTIFDTVFELSKYTKENDLIFPKDRAKAGGLLRCLLRKINNPMADRRSGGARGGRKGKGKKDLSTIDLDF